VSRDAPHGRRIVREGRGEVEDRGSRFVAWAFPVADEDAFRRRLEAVRAEYPKARHHCWAFRIGGRHRFSDDGEPGGTAGNPMLRALEAAGVDDAAVVCVRWFGGVKLGTGGLARAYGGAARAALADAELAPFVPRSRLPLRLPFDATGLLDELPRLFPDVSLSGDFDAEGWRGSLEAPADGFEAVLAHLRGRGVRLPANGPEGGA